MSVKHRFTSDDPIYLVEVGKLDDVLTMSEVRSMWAKSQSQVLMAIWKDHLIARQTPQGLWLISRWSCEYLWGKVENE